MPILIFHGNNKFLRPCHPAEICLHWLQNHKNFNKPVLKLGLPFHLFLNSHNYLEITCRDCKLSSVVSEDRRRIYCSQNSTNVSQVGKLVLYREADWKEICHRVQEWRVTIINGEERSDRDGCRGIVGPVEGCYWKVEGEECQMKHQLDATLCRFYFCRVTLHVSGVKCPSSGVFKTRSV